MLSPYNRFLFYNNYELLFVCKYLMKHTKKISRSLLWEMKRIFSFVRSTCLIGYKNTVLIDWNPCTPLPSLLTVR
jgi:hypothetical protein